MVCVSGVARWSAADRCGLHGSALTRYPPAILDRVSTGTRSVVASARALPTLGAMTAGHSVTVTPADVRIEVFVKGERIASSDRALALDETGLPRRWYLPQDDIRMDLLHPLNMHTSCPFKGEASYWTLTVGDAVLDGVAWGYPEPIGGAEAIAGHVSFYNDRVDLRVDGGAEAAVGS